jgi:DcaP outer membrane protein
MSEFDTWRRAIDRVCRTAVLPLLVAAAMAAPAAVYAQAAKKPAAPSLSTRVAQQKKQIEAQQATIEEQKMQIAAHKAVADSQAVRIESQEARLAELVAQLDQMKARLEALESQANFPAWEDSLEKRIKQVEAATKKSPELPPDIVSAGDFPGSIRIPGSDAAIKFGGRIRTALVLTLDPLGTDDRFLTNSIPVGVPLISGQETRTNISSRASRLNIEFRTPAGKEELRAFFEGDFAGENNAFRLRHAYAQYRGFIAGQTWSTFSDPLVDVEDLDFEGISSENVIRQPQLRYWWVRKDQNRMAVAIEQPSASIQGASGVNLVPDLVARGFFNRPSNGHIQIAGVLRQIRGETLAGEVRADWGGGGSFSGLFPFRVGRLTDRIMFQANGGVGIARYINDLNSAGGMDAVFDSTGNMEALPAFGWYVAYEHSWKEWKFVETMNLRSTILWSIVAVDNTDFQPPNAYHKTNRLGANLVFSPSRRVDVGFQYIWGVRANKDGQSASANQIQTVALFRF